MHFTDQAQTQVFVEAERNTWDANPSDCMMPVAMLASRGLDLADVAPYEAPAPTVPESVTPWQAREALRLAGLLGAVNAHIDGLGDDHAAYVAWHYADRIRRNSPFVETLAPTFNLSEAQLDALFTQAAGLSL